MLIYFYRFGITGTQWALLSPHAYILIQHRAKVYYTLMCKFVSIHPDLKRYNYKGTTRDQTRVQTPMLPFWPQHAQLPVFVCGMPVRDYVLVMAAAMCFVYRYILVHNCTSEGTNCLNTKSDLQGQTLSY